MRYIPLKYVLLQRVVRQSLFFFPQVFTSAVYPSSQDMLRGGSLTHGHDYSTNCQDSKDTNDEFIAIRSQEREIETSGALKFRPVEESLKLVL